MDRLKQAKDFFEGRLSGKEAEHFLKWYLSSESEEEVYTEIDKLWSGKHKSDDQFDWDGQLLFSDIRKKKDNQRPLMASQPAARAWKGKHASAGGFLNTWWKVAAMLLILVTASVQLVHHFIFKGSEPDTQAVDRIVKSNPPGQKSKVYLPDGTIVHLNAQSTLWYDEGYARDREVHLEGEAFFEVVKDTLRPFTVYSGRLATTALGTSFNIRAYKECDKVEVTLVTGKVKIADKVTNKSLLLDPGEAVRVEQEHPAFNKKEADLLTSTSWKDGILYFDSTPFGSVVRELERWYGVQIRINGTPEKVKCSGTFRNEYLSNVLDILSHNIGFEYVLHDKKVEMNFLKD